MMRMYCRLKSNNKRNMAFCDGVYVLIVSYRFVYFIILFGGLSSRCVVHACCLTALHTVELAGDSGLASKLGGTAPPRGTAAAVAKLAWAMLLVQYSDNTAVATDQAKLALQAGAFGHLRDGVLCSAGMLDEFPFHKDVAASVCHQLLTRFLQEHRFVELLC